MIFILKDGTEFNLDELHNPDRMQVGYLQGKFDTKLVEKTALYGAMVLGIRRLKASTISLSYIANSTEYKSVTDDLTKLEIAFYQTVYLKNVDGMRLLVEPSTLKYDSADGTRGQVVTAKMTFDAVNPYWLCGYDSIAELNSLSTTSINKLEFTNTGSVPVSTVITLDNVKADTQITIQHRTSVVSFGLTSPSDEDKIIINGRLGTVTNEAGTSLISSLSEGASFLLAEVGNNELNITCDQTFDKLTVAYEEGTTYG